MARPTCAAFPRPCARPRYDANTASAATATMYVAAHGESSVNWLRAAEPRPLTRLKSLICHVPVLVVGLGHPAPQHKPLLQTTSLQVASLQVTSLHVTSLQVTSLHVTSLQVAAVPTAVDTSLQTTSLQVTSLHVTSLQVTSLHVTLL